MKVRPNVVVFVGACALVAVPLVLAQVTNRYQVASDPDARGYPRSLTVVLASPPDYALSVKGRFGNDATWKGPRYQATERPSLGGNASIDWSAGIERHAATREAILANLVHDWKEIAQGVEPIEHRVGGRAVGTIRGIWVLTQGSVMAGEARYEAGLVFPLCGRTGRLHIAALTPSGDSAGGAMGYGEYVIEGMAPTAWNREQVMATIRGISLDGNLPAGRVTAARRGGAIAGRVTDCNKHPLAAQPVRLERRAGSAWKAAGTGRTGADGAYTLQARGGGVYRVVAGSRSSNRVTVG